MDKETYFCLNKTILAMIFLLFPEVFMNIIDRSVLKFTASVVFLRNWMGGPNSDVIICKTKCVNEMYYCHTLL